MKENIYFYLRMTLMLIGFLVFIMGSNSLIEEPIFSIKFSVSDSYWVCALGFLLAATAALKPKRNEG